MILIADEHENFEVNLEGCSKLMDFEEFEWCLKSRKQSLEDILIASNGQMNSTYRMVRYAQEHIIKLAPGQIKSSVIKEDKIHLYLSNSHSYHITFVDPHFHVSNINPAAIPLTILRIAPKKTTWIYLKVYTFTFSSIVTLLNFMVSIFHE